MASWVEDDARKVARILRDAPELWRDLKLNLQYAVGDYTRIYSPPGTEEVQYSRCLQTTENCVRIRVLSTPTRSDYAVGIHFTPNEGKIDGGGIHFHCDVENDEVVLHDEDKKTVTLEEASRKILKPVFAKLPQRAPNIAL